LAILFGADFTRTPLNIHTAQTLPHMTFHHSSSKYGNEHLDFIRVTVSWSFECLGQLSWRTYLQGVSKQLNIYLDSSKTVYHNKRMWII